MLRRFKIAVSGAFGIICVLAIALWARSYRQYDTLYWPAPHRISSINGWIRIDEDFVVKGRLRKSSHHFGSVRILTVRGDVTPAGVGVPIPHGIITAFAAAFAVLPWMRWHYSVRMLLTITTLVAAGLGLLAALKR